MAKWFMRVICVLIPLLGFFIAIGLLAFKKSDRADEALFFSFIGVFVFFVILVPLFLFLRFVVFPI